MTMRAFGAGDRDKVGRAHVADLDCLVGDHARAAKSAVSRIRDALSGQFMPAGIPACQRPAAGRPERHKDAAPGCGMRGQGDRRRGTITMAMAAIRTFMRGFLANTLMNYVVHYVV
jgi:hypothetical protein